MVLTHLDKLFIQKNDTGQNFLFDSMVSMLHFIIKKPLALKTVLQKLGVETFRPIEIK